MAMRLVKDLDWCGDGRYGVDGGGDRRALLLAPLFMFVLASGLAFSSFYRTRYTNSLF
jgi:hypothetical protein